METPSNWTVLLAAKAIKAKPRFLGWKTSDQEEIERRRLRASIKAFSVQPIEPDQPLYGTFAIRSEDSKKVYTVEIRSLTEPENSCQCLDYQGNGLGTCKHIEAVLRHLREDNVRRFEQAAGEGSPRVEIYLSRNGMPEVKVAWPRRASKTVRSLVSPFFSNSNTLLAEPARAIPALKRGLFKASRKVRQRVRIAREVDEWVSRLRRREELLQSKEQFLQDLEEGKRTMDLLRYPLYPYQQEGVLHMTFGERVLLADDMGLGKTAQAVGACEVLRTIHRANRVLVVSPVSLKTEWEEQIQKFAYLPTRIIWGPKPARLKMYREPAFFYLCNYEQIRVDVDDINRILAPDVVILDEAQRIKNWQTKTAKAIKQLSSPYAFVLTGTPLENRIDELYSLVEFLDPQIFGPLFRFNRDFYQLDDKGRPVGYKNLETMRRRVRPIMLRRRKEEVEGQLPQRTVNNFFVTMEAEQRARYEEYREKVARLVARTKRRSLTKEEFDRLQKWLACMRMICDTPYILDEDCRICPKLPELASTLEDMVSSNGRKVLVFSEWERMLRLVRDLAKEMNLEFAWHTGSVPQQKRRQEIKRFKQDSNCALFLSTDSGGVGLNLQEASAVINIDLPWNPAKLEQRIARAWRKHQTRSVSVVNFVCEDSIEHRMLALLNQKRELADGVLDGLGNLEKIKMPSGRAAFLERLGTLMETDVTRVALPQTHPRPVPERTTDPYETFRDDMIARLADRVLCLETCRDTDNQLAILAVVDGNVDAVRPVAEKLVGESFSKAEQTPRLEIMDRSTYECIQRLINAGFLKVDEKFVRQFYCSAKVSGGKLSHEERLRKEAQKVFTEGNRKMQMSVLLAQGGFPLEALPTTQQAVELVLRTASLLAGKDHSVQEDQVPMAFVESTLVAKGLVPDGAAPIVARVREVAKGDHGLTEDNAKELIALAQELVAHVGQALKYSGS